jgi:hypothetical protein
MGQFTNVKIVGIDADVTRAVTGDQDTATNYQQLNILSLNDIWVASLSGAIKASLTSISANTGVSAGLASTTAGSLSAVAFISVKTDTGVFYKIPLLNV